MSHSTDPATYIRETLELCRIEVERDDADRSQQAAAEPDPKDPARRTVASACVAAEQRFSRSCGNPLEIWAAIEMITHPDVAPMAIPAWCLPYLHEAAKGLREAASGAAAKKGGAFSTVIARKLGFTRNGWSAPKDHAASARATEAALFYETLRAEGKPSSEALDTLCDHLNLGEPRSARALIKRGKKLLAHVPNRYSNSI